MKTIIQTNHQVGGHQNISLSLAASRLYERGGFREFYRGISSPLSGQIALSAVQFFVFHSVDCSLEDSGFSLFSRSFLSGGLSGLAVSFVEAPVDLMKISLQTHSPLGNSLSSLVFSAVRRFGISSIFRGLGPTSLRNSTGLAVYFAVYQKTKEKIEENGALRGNSQLETAGSAAIAGLSCCFPTIPVDVVKSRVQARAFSGFQLSSREAIREIFLHSGLRGFFAGLTPALLRALPTASTSFVAYEWAMKKLNYFLP